MFFPSFVEVMFWFFGICLVAVVQVLLIVLKLCGVLLLSWWWVLSIIPILFCVVVVLAGLNALFGSRSY